MRAYRQRRAALLVTLGCLGSPRRPHAVAQVPSSAGALVNLVIGLVAIGVSAYLALLNQASEMASRERARVLEVAYDGISFAISTTPSPIGQRRTGTIWVDQRAGRGQGKDKPDVG